ncbi:MAG: Wzz/FepE/Etk N-terminal domain-containing protein, partial [Endomicrobiaceae bacterium]|nr:Wzz/FepE/Etk N-terminal domain-containing protein [Endomicrobiaceae bacterium]
MLQNTNNVKDDSEQIDFSYYFSVVLKHVWVLLGIICIGLFASILVNIFMQPVYKSSALMMIDREDSGKIDPTSFGAWSSDEDYYRTQYKLLESRSLLEKVYNDMNLDQYHEFKNPNGWFKLKNKINIVPITRSRLLNLEVKSYDKNLSATIANTIAKTFVA